MWLYDDLRPRSLLICICSSCRCGGNSFLPPPFLFIPLSASDLLGHSDGSGRSKILSETEGPNPPQPQPNCNNTVDPVQSWVAQHEQRDSSGKFVSSEHLTNGQPSHTTPNSPNTPNHPNIPLPISFTQNNKYSEQNDPPLVAVSVTNPVTYLKLFLKRILKNEGIDIRLKIKPLTVIGMAAALSISFGAGFNISKVFFPNSSPILHREVAYQGTVNKTQDGKYYLSLVDNSLWILKPTVFYSNFDNLTNKQVLLKGNLTADKNVIEVKEVNVFDTGEKPVPYTPRLSTNSAQEKN